MVIKELTQYFPQLLAKVAVLVLGEQVEQMYRLEQGEHGESVLVSGSHLIYSPEKDQFIPVQQSPFAQLTSTACPTLACLITSDHIIPIGPWVFHDWEDNNGSVAKTLLKDRQTDRQTDRLTDRLTDRQADRKIG